MHKEQRAEAAHQIATYRMESRDDRVYVRGLDWTGRENERDVIVEALDEAAREREQDFKVPPLPPTPTDLEDWLRQQDEHWFAERWRKRRNPPAPPLVFVGKTTGAAGTLVTQIDGYRAYPLPDGTRYARDTEGTAFVDRGDRIELVPGRSDDALLAALKLAILKFDRQIGLTGSVEFRERAYKLAAQHGLADALTDPDMVSRERELLSTARLRAQPDPVSDRQISKPVKNQVPKPKPETIDMRGKLVSGDQNSRRPSDESKLAADARAREAKRGAER